MNKILSHDKIKALAVTILDEQKTNEIFACLSGTTLMKIELKNSKFDSVPFGSLIFFEGKFNKEVCEDELFFIEVDLSQEDHRFVTLKPDTIKMYEGLSVLDILESLPDLSDTKPFPKRIEFENLHLFLLKKHAHSVKLIREAVECGDFGNAKPKYIQGQAYEKIFTDYKTRTGYKPQTSEMIKSPEKLKTQSAGLETKPRKNKKSLLKEDTITVGHFTFERLIF